MTMSGVIIRRAITADAETVSRLIVPGADCSSVVVLSTALLSVEDSLL